MLVFVAEEALADQVSQGFTFELLQKDQQLSVRILYLEGLCDMDVVPNINPLSDPLFHDFFLISARQFLELLHREDRVFLLEDRVGR